MTVRTAAALIVFAGLLAPTALMARQNVVRNGSMESGEGSGGIDPHVAAEWTEFGVNVERSDTVNLVPPGEGHALKAFGDPDSTSVGACQEVPNVSPGQSVTATVQLYSPANDKLRGSGRAGLVLVFLDMFGGTIEPLYETYVLDVNSPADTWIPATLGPFSAPPGTTQVRVICRLEWSPLDILGAAYWDDAQLTIDGGPNQLLNGDFETAGVGPGQNPAGIDEWDGFEDQEKSEDVAKHGTASVKLGTREAYSGLYQNMGVLNDGDHIYMIAYAWNPSGDPLTGNSRVGIKLEFDANANVPPSEENLAFDENVDPNQWTLVDLATTVPDDMTIARIVCILNADQQTTGSVHFDSAFAERGGAPGVNQLTNASFELGPGGAAPEDWTEFSSPGVSQAWKTCFEVPAHHELCTTRAAGQAVAGIYQEIVVTPGESLYINAYLYTPGFEPLTGPARAGVKVEWAVGGVPDDIDIGVPGSPNTIGPGALQDTWLPLVIDYTMPPGSSALARFTNIIEKGTAQTGRVYIDACEAVVLNRFDGSDVDGDDDEDLHDFAWFQRCYTGPGAGALPWNGIVFDSDDDADIDLVDLGYFLPRMTGPN